VVELCELDELYNVAVTVLVRTGGVGVECSTGAVHVEKVVE
jgi:uncharacterized protein YcbK (DUF882 family)